MKKGTKVEVSPTDMRKPWTGIFVGPHLEGLCSWVWRDSTGREYDVLDRIIKPLES